MSLFNVNLTPSEAAEIVQRYVVNEGMSTKCVGSYKNVSPEGKEVIVMVFEKYFMRNSSRASLSVAINNLSETTSVYAIGSGGGQGSIFSFDWGAAESFSELVEQALRSYRV